VGQAPRANPHHRAHVLVDVKSESRAPATHRANVAERRNQHVSVVAQMGRRVLANRANATVEPRRKPEAKKHALAVVDATMEKSVHVTRVAAAVVQPGLKKHAPAVVDAKMEKSVHVTRVAAAVVQPGLKKHAPAVVDAKMEKSVHVTRVAAAVVQPGLKKHAPAVVDAKTEKLVHVTRTAVAVVPRSKMRAVVPRSKVRATHFTTWKKIFGGRTQADEEWSLSVDLELAFHLPECLYRKNLFTS